MSTSHDSYSSHTEPLLNVTTSYDNDPSSHIDVTRGNLNHDDVEVIQHKKYCRCCTRRQAIGCAICCTLFSIITINMVCVTYWVIVPYMAQKQVDQSSITFDRMSLSNPNGTTFTIDVFGSLYSESPFNADIDSTVMSLYYTFPDPSTNTTNSTLPHMIESRIGSVRFPSLALSKSNADVVIDTKTVFDIEDDVGFQAFMVDLVHSNTTTWRLQGDLTVHIHIASFLTISVSNIHLDKVTTIKGMHGLRDANLTVLSLDVVGGDANSVWLLPTLSINDTSDIEMDMVPDGVTLNLIYYLDGVGDIVIGNGTVSDFSIRKGVSVLSTIIHIYHQPQHPTLVQRLLSDYLAGMDIPVRVTGAPNAVPQFPYMTHVLRTLQLPAILPGIHHKLMKRAFIHLGLDSLYQLDTAMEFQNIWNVTLALTACDLAVLWKGEPVGRANQIFPTPIVAPPFAKVVSNPVPVVIKWGFTFIEALIRELTSGSILLDIDGTMDVSIYGNTGTPFRDTIYYKQLNINVTTANANTPTYHPVPIPTDPPTSSPSWHSP